MEREIVEYPTNLPLDKDIRDSQSNLKDQEAEHGTWNINKDESFKKTAPKKEQQEPKDKTKLQTAVDVRSDPAYNSDDGYETRYMNPTDEKEIVKYKTDLPYDSDIVTTKANLKKSEDTEGHKLDPIPFLEVQESQENMDPTQKHNFSQGKSKQKTAVKTQ